MTKPLVETTRFQFSGLTADEYDEPAIGDVLTMTITARCVGHNEREMAAEGTRRSANMKVERVFVGINPHIGDPLAGDDKQPSLYDASPDDPDAEPAGPAYVAGPEFSGAAR